jgi:hypothetical protein
MVTRYDLTEEVETGKVDITPVPESMDGRYVSWEDYCQLQEENRRLTTALRQAINKRDIAQRDLKRLKLSIWVK